MSSRVWAPFTGNWTEDVTGTNWTHCIPFTSIPDLVRRARGQGVSSIGRLGIVAHGDEPGVVRLDRAVSPGGLASFDPDIRGLAPLLSLSAKVIFFSCIAGRGPEGTQLLTGLSNRLPGRVLIGFEIWGEITGLPQAPGAISECTAPAPGGTCFEAARGGRLSPWGRFAKWVVNGEVIRYGVLEQNGRPNRTCANPRCPGHSDPSHQCSRWHPAGEW